MNRLRDATACALLVLLPGCTRPTTPPPDAAPGVKAAPPAKEAPASPVDFRLVGVVRRVTPAAGQVLIAHEAIPGFMGAMTMPFSVKDRALLDDLRPGDEVEGTLRVQKKDGVIEDYELLDLGVTRPALSPPKTLSLSGKGLTLREIPKRLEPGMEVPDFAMTTQEGTPLRLSDLRGRVVALTFIYTRCPLPDFCPLMDRKFASLAEKLAASPRRAEGVRLLSVSFDPEHDTPAILREHAKVQGARPPLWRFAVASHEELARVAAPLGLTYGPMPNEIVHNLCTAVIDREGRLARVEVGSASRDWSPAGLFKLISTLLPEGRGGDAPTQ